jgi:enediyne polyketide synthase
MWQRAAARVKLSSSSTATAYCNWRISIWFSDCYVRTSVLDRLPPSLILILIYLLFRYDGGLVVREVERQLKIQIDPDLDTFLADHCVDGVPLLPTVMQLDLAARGLQAWSRAGTSPPAGVLFRGMRLGPPVRFDQPGVRDLDLLCTPVRATTPGQAALCCELRSPDQDAPHLTVIAERTAGPAPRAPGPAEWAGTPCGPGLVYPPLFHGPAFQVVAGFGRAGTGLAAVLSPALPPVSWASEPTVLRPQLLELLLQCCGIYALASTGRMMVPAGIEAVHWYPESLTAGDPSRAVAVVRPRLGQQDPGRVFDGQVVAPDGTLLVTVTGYQTTDLGRPPDLSHAARLDRCLDSHSAPAHWGPGEPAIP